MHALKSESKSQENPSSNTTFLQSQFLANAEKTRPISAFPILQGELHKKKDHYCLDPRHASTVSDLKYH